MRKAKQWTAETLVEGVTVTIPFSISENDMETFARLSGDLNPIHTEDAYAIEAGFKGRLVYGGLLVSKLSGLFGMEIPGLGGFEHSLSIDFISPLYVGEKAELEAVVTYVNMDLGVVQLAIDIKRGSDMIARVKAQTGYVKKRLGTMC